MFDLCLERTNQCSLSRVQIFYTRKTRQSSSVRVIAFQQAGFVIGSVAVPEHKTQAVLAIKIKNNQMPAVFLWIKWFHRPSVEKCRSIPFDLFANCFISGQDGSSNILSQVGQRMFQLFHV